MAREELPSKLERKICEPCPDWLPENKNSRPFGSQAPQCRLAGRVGNFLVAPVPVGIKMGSFNPCNVTAMTHLPSLESEIEVASARRSGGVPSMLRKNATPAAPPASPD